MMESDSIHTPGHPSLPRRPTWVTATPPPVRRSSRRQTVYPTPAPSSGPSRSATPLSARPSTVRPSRPRQCSSPHKRIRLGDNKDRPIVLDSDSDSDEQRPASSGRVRPRSIPNGKYNDASKSDSALPVKLITPSSRQRESASPSPAPSVISVKSPSPPPVAAFGPFHRRLAREARIADHIDAQRRHQRGRALTPSTSGEDTDIDSDSDLSYGVQIKVDPRFIQPQKTIGDMFFLYPTSHLVGPRPLIRFEL